MTNAEDTAIEVLGWLAAQPELMTRFLALTGLTADGLRSASAQPGFYAGLVNFLVNHEPTLKAFCNDTGKAPATVVEAYRALCGGAENAGI